MTAIELRKKMESLRAASLLWKQSREFWYPPQQEPQSVAPVVYDSCIHRGSGCRSCSDNSCPLRVVEEN